MTKLLTLDGDKVLEMTGSQLMDALNQNTIGASSSFVVVRGKRPPRTFHAWISQGRGRHSGKFYVHLTTEVPVVLILPDGSREPSSMTTIVHVRGRMKDRIRTYEEI